MPKKKPPVDPSDKEAVRRAVWQTLASAESAMTANGIAAATGLPPSSVNNALNWARTNGLVEGESISSASGRGSAGLSYSLANVAAENAIDFRDGKAKPLGSGIPVLAAPARLPVAKIDFEAANRRLMAELDIMREKNDDLSRHIAAWQRATQCDSPENAAIKLTALTDQANNIAATRINQAVGQAGEILRQWQAATGQETPEAAKLELNKLKKRESAWRAATCCDNQNSASWLPELAGNAAEAAAKRGGMNTAARFEKMTVTGITGAMHDDEGTVRLVFNRRNNARAVRVSLAAISGWIKALNGAGAK